MRALSGAARAAVVAVVVVVAAGLAAYLMVGHGGSSSSIKAPAVVIVYGKGQQSLAESLKAAVEKQLGPELPSGTRYYVVPASKLDLSLPVYPALLFKMPLSDIKGRLASVVMRDQLPGGYYPFRYDYFASYVTQVAILTGKGFPEYSHTAKVLIVEGNVPGVGIDAARLKEVKNRLELALSALFVAKVTDIKVVKNPPAGLKPDEYPAVYAESKADLAKFNPDLAEVAPGIYYDVNASVAKFLVSMGLATAIMVPYEPIPGLAQHPSIGKGPINVAIFEDILCPFCAKLYKDTMPYLYSLAENGTITLHLLDLVVHPYPQDMEFHHLMICYYAKTGNAAKYYEVFKDTYASLFNCSSGSTFCTPVKNYTGKLADIVKKLEKELGATPNCTASQYTEESSMGASRLGIMGTPGIVLWKTGGKYMIITMGFHKPSWFKEVIKWLEEH